MALPRLHWFEVNDSSWAPRALRDTIVESLSRMLEWGDMLSGLVAPFEEFVAQSGAREVLDVCAGAAGPARLLVSAIRRAGHQPPRFILTDLYPQLDAWRETAAQFPDEISFEAEPVDATRIPEALARGRARVIINAFHHFPPELAQSILADAVRSSDGIFIAEPFDRNPLRFFAMVPIGVFALILNPILSRRQRLQKALLSLTPLVPATAVWDGVISTMRVYTRDELMEMVRPLGDSFEWTWGRHRFTLGGHGYYFFGVRR